MSDPTPEDLYEALRKRLADYGQEPPPDMWAGIRQQLPPPVAVPRRRRWRAGIVLLVLVMASLATWQWQRAGTLAGQSGTLAQQAATSEKSASQLSASAGGAGPAATAGQDLSRAGASEQGGSTPGLSGATPNATAGRAGTAETLAANELAVKTQIAKLQKSGAFKVESTAKSVTPAVALATEAAGRPARRQRALALAAAASPEARQQRLLRAGRGTRFGRPATLVAHPGNESALGSAVAQPMAATRRAWAATNSAASAADAAEKAGVATPSGVAAASASRTPAGTPDRSTAPLLAADNSAQSPAGASSDTAQPDGGDRLALRVAGLQLPAGAAPAAPQPVQVAPLPPLVPTVVARWAVQLVAGPGLTYRHLGSSSLSFTTTSLAKPVAASPATSGANTNRIPTTTTTTSVAELERPALGYSAQLSIRRTLTPHWTVSAGLGYAEYATGLALRQVSAAQITRANYDFAFLDSLSRTSGSTIRQRDTYRFLTVPVRAGYVWTTGPRWQVGLLGGVDAAIYLGGTTTEGSACGCQPQTWGASGSPYRSLSLAASLGAEVRYRLAGPWQLLAQPTASYLLTPLAKPVSGYAIRHLLGGTALFGVSYDLP